MNCLGGISLCRARNIILDPQQLVIHHSHVTDSSRTVPCARRCDVLVEWSSDNVVFDRAACYGSCTLLKLELLEEEVDLLELQTLLRQYILNIPIHIKPVTLCGWLLNSLLFSFCLCCNWDNHTSLENSSSTHLLWKPDHVPNTLNSAFPVKEICRVHVVPVQNKRCPSLNFSSCYIN